MELKFFLAIALSGTVSAAAELPPLAAYNVDPRAITVSGVSSGAFMAVQLHFAFSGTFSGAASIAGGVYWCAQGDSRRAQSECMGPARPENVYIYVHKALELARANLIDPLENLKNHRIFVYASPTDSVITAANSEKLIEFYKSFLSADQIQFENSIASAHGFPTLDVGNPCSLGFLPWLLKCQYDTAGVLLRQMYGPLRPRVSAVPSHLLEFTQREFGDAKTPIYEKGWIYIPESCANGVLCRLHVALHGCQMNPEFIQDQFARNAGYNEWAESNDTIILYPQSAKLPSTNPYACWDWFGLSGVERYITRDGPQMAAIKKMVDRIESGH